MRDTVISGLCVAVTLWAVIEDMCLHECQVKVPVAGPDKMDAVAATPRSHLADGHRYKPDVASRSKEWSPVEMRSQASSHSELNSTNSLNVFQAASSQIGSQLGWQLVGPEAQNPGKPMWMSHIENHDLMNGGCFNPLHV